MNRGVLVCGLCTVIVTSCLAAPTLRGDDKQEQEKETALVRTKRADEIIFDGQPNPPATGRVKKSSDESQPDSDAAAEATKAVDEQKQTFDSSDEKPEEDKTTAEDMSEPAVESEATQPEAEVDESLPTDNNDNGDVSDDVTEDAEAHSRSERSANGASVMMVAENMAAPAAEHQKLRAKRDLDADVLRELFDAQRDGELLPEYDQGEADYESPEEERPVEFGDEEEEESVAEQQPRMPWRYYDLGRPKRNNRDDSEAYEEEEAAEREAVRELLAERAAEEAREALLAYLVSGRPSSPELPYDEDEEGDMEDDQEPPLLVPDDGGYDVEDDGEDDVELEPIDDDDDNLIREDVDVMPTELDRLAEQDAAAAAEKRFEYPYSYEPYGGRWGALVPGAKRSDVDPYDRLYRLAEALSGPPGVQDDK